MGKISGIYLITNITNNKHYVGRSNDCSTRISKHKSALNRNKHHNIHLQNAWNKHGASYFIFEILEEYQIELLPSFENWWCNMLNSHNKHYGYNVEPTSPCGKIRTSLETISKIRKSNTGKTVSDETKGKLRVCNLGKILTEETKLKLKNSKRNQKIDSYNNLGEFLGSYKSIREAGRVLNIDYKNISKCISREYNLIKNKIFKKHGDLLTAEEISNRNKNSFESKKIKVIGYNKDGSLIGEYESCFLAGKENKLDSYKISLCVKGKQKYTKGTTWKLLKT